MRTAHPTVLDYKETHRKLPLMTDKQPFIPAKVDLNKGDPELLRFVGMNKHDLRSRWDTPRGREILAAWQQAGFARGTLDALVGRYYGHTDIRGINLTGKSLQDADLSRVDLFAANLRKTNLSRSDLSDSWLSESDIRGASFDFAIMDDTRVDTVMFDADTSLRHVNLNAVNFTMRPLLEDLAIGQQRIADLEANHRILAAVLRTSCDYGRSFGRFFLWVFGLIIVFGLLYTFPGTTSASGVFDNLYFSVVTFTTLGYGDIVPVSALGRVLVIIEVMVGYMMLGLLVGIISRRVIGR